MQQNAADGGNRRFILVQLPEPLDEPKTLDDGTRLTTIADICRERVRRAGHKIAAEQATAHPAQPRTLPLTDTVEHASAMATGDGRVRADLVVGPPPPAVSRPAGAPGTGETGAGRGPRASSAPTRPASPVVNASAPISLDTGFRAYKLAPSNFRPWDGTIPEGSVATQLAMVADHIVPGATDDALLAELLLKLGFELTTPVATLTLAGKTVYDVEGGAVLICLDRHITFDVVEQMAARTPAMIVCLDAGFPDDRTKVNAGQIIASHARDEETSIAFKVV